MTTTASRWSASASSASSSAARVLTSRSDPPIALMRIHPVEQRRALVRRAAGSSQEVHGDLAQRRDTHTVSLARANERDALEIAGQDDVGTGVYPSQAQPIDQGIELRCVEQRETWNGFRGDGGHGQR